MGLGDLSSQPHAHSRSSFLVGFPDVFIHRFKHKLILKSLSTLMGTEIRSVSSEAFLDLV